MKQTSLCKIATITTVPITIRNFCKDQIEALNKAGLQTMVICAGDSELAEILPKETSFASVSFTRVISPLKDIKALLQLVNIFRKNKIDMVQYTTPKAALLGSIAAFICRVPVRIYLLWGLYYDGQGGMKKRLLKLIEKMTCAFSTHILPNSFEMADVIVREGITKKGKCEVLLNGSLGGVDTERFSPRYKQVYKDQIRRKLDIPQDGIVIGVFSRLTGDKGINEIVCAFKEIAADIKNVYLLIAGKQEEKDPILPETEDIIKNHTKIRFLDWQYDLVPYYAAIDIFCLPTYREGFPVSPLEAQAMEVPVVATDVMGCREAVVNNVTGFLVKPKDKEALIGPLKKLIFDNELRKQMGLVGKQRMQQMFDARDMMISIVKHRIKLVERLQR